MADNSKSTLLARYEEMCRSGQTYYFDTDEIEEIAYQYEISQLPEEALQAIDMGLRIHAENINLLVLRAKYLNQLDRMTEAKELIYSIPNNSEIGTIVKAEILYGLENDYETAYSMMTTYIEQNKVDVDFCLDCLDLIFEYETIGQLQQFVTFAMKQVGDTKELPRELGTYCMNNANYEDAIDAYNMILDADPYSLQEWINIGNCHALLREFDQAIEASDFALAIKENDEKAISLKGYCLYDKGEYEAATELFLTFSKITADKVTAYEILAECYIKRTMLPDAIAYLHDAYDLNKESANICYQLGHCYYDLGDDNNGIKYLHKALDIEPQDSETLALLGEIYFNNKRWADAVSCLRDALEYDKKNKHTATLLGDARMELKAYADAVESYEQALLLDEHDVKLKLKLILAHYHAENLGKAVELLEELDKSTTLLDTLTDLTPSNKEEMVRTR